MIYKDVEEMIDFLTIDVEDDNGVNNVSIEKVEMSDEEFDSLPKIDELKQ